MNRSERVGILMRTAANEKGVGLVEVLASVTIFAVVAAGLAAATLTSMRSNRTSRNYTAAAALAQDRIEFFRGLYIPAPNAPTPTPSGPTYAEQIAKVVDGTDQCDPDCCSTSTSCAVSARPRFTRTWTITAGPVSAMRLVTVTVTWSDPAPRRLTSSSFVCMSSTCV